MRILHVTRETEGDRRFGLGRSLMPVCQALQQRGHQVRYLTQQDLSPQAWARLPVWARRLGTAASLWFSDVAHHVAMAWAERLNIGRVAALLARRERYDVVHLHDPWIAFGFFVTAGVHRLPASLRWGFTEHGFGAYADATREEGLPCTPRLMRALRRLEAGMARRAHWVICPTELARQQLGRDLACAGALPATWHTVPHARPVLTLPTREQARTALGSGDGLQLLAVGRINPVKRLEAVVQACASLQQPLTLTLLAGGDAAPLHALAAAAPQLRLEVKQVDDVGPYLAAADIYLSASRNESFGIAHLEAMVAGLPLLCTAVGGVPEVVGPAAWLVPGGDAGLAQQLADGLRTLIDDDALRRHLARQAAMRGRAWPDAAQTGERYEAIYRGLV